MHTYMYGQVIQPPAGISASSVSADTFTDMILSPSSSVISFDDLTIYRIGAGPPHAFHLELLHPHHLLPSQRLWPLQTRSP